MAYVFAPRKSSVTIEVSKVNANTTYRRFNHQNLKYSYYKSHCISHKTQFLILVLKFQFIYFRFYRYKENNFPRRGRHSSLKINSIVDSLQPCLVPMLHLKSAVHLLSSTLTHVHKELYIDINKLRNFP